MSSISNCSLNNIVFSKNIFADARNIIETAKHSAFRAIDSILVQRNWLLGKRIHIEEMNGKGRADYGKEIIKKLSKELSEIYGKGFDRINLYYFLRFYRAFHDNYDKNGEIVYAVSKQFLPNLSWTHFRILLQEENGDARAWYANEAQLENWSTRTLQRNISSQYYYRLLKSQDKHSVHNEMVKLTSPLQDKTEFIKNPVIAEFLGLEECNDFRESTLENAILDNLQKFMMEIGKGYAWMARQQRIHTEKADYYIDLVFYNVILKCYVLIDLKTDKITHQDIGQMDMYIRMYDELKRTDGDNPTIGIILCADTDDDIARFSVLHGNEQLFASKYLTYLPSKEQLREEIERQKFFYQLTQKEHLPE